MDEPSLLLAKVDALREQVNCAQLSLKTAKVDSRLSKAASIGFATLFDRRLKELTKLRESIQKTGAGDGTWQQMHRSSASCKELFKECLEFLGGAMLRDTQKGNDICDIADVLLKQLSHKTVVEWGRVTLLAEAHFFTEITGLIRLPFPDYGIWNLPIAVHELGHFIGPRIPDGLGGFPFQARLDTIEKKYEGQPSEEQVAQIAQEQSQLREIFSDLFATFSLGPAYACACIVFLFDPQDAVACVDSATHPSHRKRVHLVLAALTQMSKTTAGNPYRKIVRNLRTLWQNNLRRADEQKCANPEKVAALNYQLLDLYPIMRDFIPKVQYSGWDRAVQLSKEFPLEGKVVNILTENHTMADVLNAVWLWRLRQVREPNLVHQVNLEAIALCRQLM